MITDHEHGRTKTGSSNIDELRRRGIASLQAGCKPTEVTAAVGVNLHTVFRWLGLYRSGRWGKLEACKRGGRPPKLDAKALKWVYDTVVEKNPLQFPFALWTAKSVSFMPFNHRSIRARWSSYFFRLPDVRTCSFISNVSFRFSMASLLVCGTCLTCSRPYHGVNPRCCSVAANSVRIQCFLEVATGQASGLYLTDTAPGGPCSAG